MSFLITPILPMPGPSRFFGTHAHNFPEFSSKKDPVMKIVPGAKFKFAYPTEFVSLPDYSAHRGAIVTVIRPLRPEEYDYQDSAMFAIRADDGWNGVAWEEELESVERTQS